MKRMTLIAVLLLILALLPAALADTQPSVSFTTNQITAQCGNTVTLTLAANAAPSRDITINITDERGNPFPVVLRQGETRATLQVTTARAGYNKRYEYAIQPGSDYQRGATRGVSVLYKGVTVGQFSQEMLQTYLGETLNVGFKLEGPKTLEKGQANFRKQCEAALFGIYDMKRKYVKHMEIFVSKLCAYDDISEKNLQLHYKNTLQQ